MAGKAAHGSAHGALMDSVYKSQRHIYDLTRKYYLFGRDTLIEGLDARPGMTVLEVACGTGRNLAKIGECWPGARLYGFDISREMLLSAAKTLGPGTHLGEGDACTFERRDVFGHAAPEAGFDRIVISYSLSMIPEWQRALDRAAMQLAPGGQLHIVDFGDLSGMPGPLAAGLRAWLGRFHVATRDDLPAAARDVAEKRAMSREMQRGPASYYQLHILTAD